MALCKVDSVQHRAIKILGGNGNEMPSFNIYSLDEDGQLLVNAKSIEWSIILHQNQFVS